MLKNFLLVAFRHLKRNRLYSVINILGLAIGLATSLFIGIYILKELSYDKHFSNWERIYRVQMHSLMNGNEMHVTITGAPAAEAIKNEIPGVLSTTRLLKSGFTVKVNENVYAEPRIFYADSTFYDIFDYKIILGEKENLLNKPQTVVLTESTSKKYFGEKNPVGESLQIDGIDYEVTGVVEDCKRESHFHYDMLASVISLEISRYDTWMNNDVFNVYVLLDQNANIHEVNEKLQAMVLKKVEPEVMYVFKISMDELIKKGSWVKYYLLPITDIHLKSHAATEIEPNSSMIYIYIFSIIAVFILIIACINYMNLSTARSAVRAKETAIRKVVGAKKGGLISQFLIESVTQSLIALIFALIILELGLPIFNSLTQNNLSIGYTTNPWIIPGIILIGIIIGLISGIYSAVYLSSVNVIVMLKTKLLSGNQKKWFRNTLIVFQFTISIFIIIATLIINSQLNYIQTKDIGFDKNNMLIINNLNRVSCDTEVLKQQLSEVPGVVNVAASNRMIGEGFGGFPSKSEDDLSTARVSRLLIADNNIEKTFGLKVIDGRFFSNDFPNDTFSVIINEAAAREYNYKNPVGKHLVTEFGNETIRWKIIGVVKDFNFYSLHEKIGSLVIAHSSQSQMRMLTVKYQSKNIDKMLASIKNTWTELNPNVPFDYYFFEDKYSSQYNEEYRTRSLFTSFSILAIFVSCLGLFGLASFLAEKKTREIAIRKAIGASDNNVVLMLLKQFTSWVIVANIFAYPIAWIFAKKWLQNFAFHININPLYFVLATFIVLTIALITVSSQALLAARTNPAEKLKYE